MHDRTTTYQCSVLISTASNEINDSLGHQAGDELLMEVAKRLSACLRECEQRCAGWEVRTVILQVGNEVQASEASSLARRLIEAVETPYDIQGHHSRSA